MQKYTTSSLSTHSYFQIITTVGERCRDRVTYFPEFNGALKLLTSDYEEDGQVDARVECWLQLKTLPVPGDGMG